MQGFADANEARQVLSALIQELDPRAFKGLQIVYSYRFTDIDYSCTVVIDAEKVSLQDGILPNSESTIETDSKIFHQVMTGQTNVVYAHLSNQARIIGSVGNVLRFRALLPHFSQAYQNVMAQRARPAPEAGTGAG